MASVLRNYSVNYVLEDVISVCYFITKYFSYHKCCFEATERSDLTSNRPTLSTFHYVVCQLSRTEWSDVALETSIFVSAGFVELLFVVQCSAFRDFTLHRTVPRNLILNCMTL